MITTSVLDSYEQSVKQVEQMIMDGGYHEELSMEAMVDLAKGKADYDVAYIASAYSASMERSGLSQSDMEKKLRQVAGKLFPVTAKEMETQVVHPVFYYTYKPVDVTVVTKVTFAGMAGGVLVRNYETEVRTYYVVDRQCETEEELLIETYTGTTVRTPVYAEGKISGTEISSYFVPAGWETLVPEKETVKYLECTVHPFDEEIILDAFGIDKEAPYEGFNITYGEVIKSRAEMLKRTLGMDGDSGDGQIGGSDGRKEQ